MEHLISKVGDDKYEYRGFTIKEIINETVKFFLVEIPELTFSTNALVLEDVMADIDEVVNKYSTEPLTELKVTIDKK